MTATIHPSYSASLDAAGLVAELLGERVVITVNSTLVSPKAVADFYRGLRNARRDLRPERSGRDGVWPAEVVKFVDFQLAKDSSLSDNELCRRWNRRYPQYHLARGTVLRRTYNDHAPEVHGRMALGSTDDDQG